MHYATLWGMNTLKNSGKILLNIVLILAAISLVTNIMIKRTPPLEPTAQATATTDKNAFVSGCTGKGGTEQYCGCTYDKLLAMYPDFATNQDRVQRILKDGYNSTETDAMVSCTIPTQVN